MPCGCQSSGGCGGGGGPPGLARTRAGAVGPAASLTSGGSAFPSSSLLHGQGGSPVPPTQVLQTAATSHIPARHSGTHTSSSRGFWTGEQSFRYCCSGSRWWRTRDSRSGRNGPCSFQPQSPGCWGRGTPVLPGPRTLTSVLGVYWWGRWQSRPLGSQGEIRKTQTGQTGSC